MEYIRKIKIITDARVERLEDKVNKFLHDEHDNIIDITDIKFSPESKYADNTVIIQYSVANPESFEEYKPEQTLTGSAETDQVYPEPLALRMRPIIDESFLKRVSVLVESTHFGEVYNMIFDKYGNIFTILVHSIAHESDIPDGCIPFTSDDISNKIAEYFDDVIKYFDDPDGQSRASFFMHDDSDNDE